MVNRWIRRGNPTSRRGSARFGAMYVWFAALALVATVGLVFPTGTALANDEPDLAELSADEFVTWLDGKPLAFVELWDPA